MGKDAGKSKNLFYKGQMMMKAAVFTEPGRLEIREVPQPELKDNDILVKVKACGICGSDLNIYRRNPPIPKFWPGHEISGIVEEGVLKKGTRVSVAPLIPCGECEQCRSGLENICANCLFISFNLPGGFAEYVIAPKENVFELPASVDLDTAVLIEPLADVLHAIDIGGEVRGKRVVVFGCGTIGLLTVAALNAIGAEYIVAIAKYPHQERLAKELGADVLNSGETDIVQKILSMFNGKKADIVFETVGGYESPSIIQSIDILKPGGVIVLTGVHYKTPQMNLKYLTEREIQVKGSQRYNKKDFAKAVKFLSGKDIGFDKLITHRVKLKDINKGYEIGFNKGKTGAVKVVVNP
ncbi:MAG: alcohol dehydrogenase catalytic domain-containing protein [Deltaproteobacteria bacterium]|nr:alcohol dehydrogenase catalytic domain-containing protein [Deltaproteobacteria bacterium]